MGLTYLHTMYMFEDQRRACTLLISAVVQIFTTMYMSYFMLDAIRHMYRASAWANVFAHYQHKIVSYTALLDN